MKPDEKINEDIFEAIAINTPFSAEDVRQAYDEFGSYDLLVRACDFAMLHGLVDLRFACVAVKAGMERLNKITP